MLRPYFDQTVLIVADMETLEARDRQRRRLTSHGVRRNGEMGPSALRATCNLTGRAERALERLHACRSMTGRTIDRLIKVARTIADLAGTDDIDRGAILQAAGYRALDDEPGVDIRVMTGAQAR